MARVSFDKYDRKINAFRRWFKGKRAENSISQQMLAVELNKTQASVSEKLKHGEITYRELLVFFQSVNATDDEIIKYMRLE